MNEKRLFRSSFHASGGTTRGPGRLPNAQHHWSQPHQQSSLASHGAPVSQLDFGDPLQDLQCLLNRLLKDGEAGEPLMRPTQPHQRQQTQQAHPALSSNREELSWGRRGQFLGEAEQQDRIGMRRHEDSDRTTSYHHDIRRNDEYVATAAAVPRQDFTGQELDRGNFDHWFTAQKNATGQLENHSRHSRYRSDLGCDLKAPITDRKPIGRVPPSPSWPLNSQRQKDAREIVITDLRRQAGGLAVDRPAIGAVWWRTLQPAGGTARSDSSGGESRSRAVSNRREATLRASAEQLDHLSRRDGASNSAVALPASSSHRRSASDAAVRGYRASEDGLDYEETPLLSRANGENDGASTSQVATGMSLWYRPKISREQAVAALSDAAVGSFLVRDSQTYPGAYGLALRVPQPPPSKPMALKARPMQDSRGSLVRHFLIEVSPGGGIRLRGCSNEPIFRSLAELVQCHSLTPLALPCCLRLPNSTTTTQRGATASREHRVDEATSGRRGTTYRVLYFCTADVPSTQLVGSQQQQQQWPHLAVSAAVGQVASPGGPRPMECRMRVSGRGVKLSGLGWHTEFRLAYAAEDCLACELDPAGRRFRFPDGSGAQKDSSLFGLIVKKYGYYGDQTACLVLGGNLDSTAATIVDFVNLSCLKSAASGSRSRARHH